MIKKNIFNAITILLLFFTLLTGFNISFFGISSYYAIVSLFISVFAFIFLAFFANWSPKAKVVIAIVVILLSSAYPFGVRFLLESSMETAVTRAQQQIVKSEVGQTKVFLEEYYKEKGIYPIKVEEVNGKFFETEDFYLESKSMTHGIPCNAYAFIKKGKMRIDKEKLKKSKLPFGPLLQKLKQGKNIVYQRT